jgi:hypothetical protein
MLSICRLHVFAGHLEQPVAPLPRVRLACQLQTYRAYSLNLLSILGDIGCTNVLIAGIQRGALTKVPRTSPLAKLVRGRVEGPANRRADRGGGQGLMPNFSFHRAPRKCVDYPPSSIINMAERTQFQLSVVRHMHSRIRAAQRSRSARLRLENARRS